MANLVTRIMPNTILPNRAGFIRNTHIHQCIATVLEGVNMIDRKVYGSSVVIET